MWFRTSGLFISIKSLCSKNLASHGTIGMKLWNKSGKYLEIYTLDKPVFFFFNSLSIIVIFFIFGGGGN